MDDWAISGQEFNGTLTTFVREEVDRASTLDLT
mgnify:CR=1 FL=1